MMNKFDNKIADIIRKESYSALLDRYGWETVELAVNSNHDILTAKKILIHLKVIKFNLYEICVCGEPYIHDGGGISGCDTKFVLAMPKCIRKFPFFNYIISINDISSERLNGAIIWE